MKKFNISKTVIFSWCSILLNLNLEPLPPPPLILPHQDTLIPLLIPRPQDSRKQITRVLKKHNMIQEPASHCPPCLLPQLVLTLILLNTMAGFHTTNHRSAVKGRGHDVQISHSLSRPCMKQISAVDDISNNPYSSRGEFFYSQRTPFKLLLNKIIKILIFHWWFSFLK